MTDSWYELVPSGTPLTQGDLIPDCLLFGWKPEPINLQTDHDEREVLRGATEAVRADVVVMTQACDLQNNKVRNIILCPHFSLNQYRIDWEEHRKAGEQHPSKKAWKTHCNDIVGGFLWNLAILNADACHTLTAEHRIVDFHEVYTVPRTFIESLLTQRAEVRPRLLPPYREHLSQAFARFFMRVGLPTPVATAW